MNPTAEALVCPAGATRTAVIQLDERALARATTPRRHHSAVIISIAGELDASNDRAWTQLLSKIAATISAPGPFLVDLGNLDFIGCRALAVLARETERCRRRGIRLCLISHQSIVARAIAAAGLSRALPIYPTIQTALSRVSAGPSCVVNAPVGEEQR
jgi:anti-anti-sigma factor